MAPPSTNGSTLDSEYGSDFHTMYNLFTALFISYVASVPLVTIWSTCSSPLYMFHGVVLYVGSQSARSPVHRICTIKLTMMQT
ncbi:uncharacterized protein BDW47DRAFT_101740 [Aspergillus candidus]|uniref:Uncharacterized protein n=1 Tax=Aspergillus candidus TaxID=41067 RepID=A0A2I2FI38_ASPCN|nr:hypothetical protein BDW47DRAFT_101740 [Aspergillus candidus]PLB40298.1 hypothetical protein BDW47DRAFT_101740 [Aspergillus candidus]